MTKLDLIELLRSECANGRQSIVAKTIGYTPGAISQILSGSYKADPSAVLEVFEKIYIQGKDTVACPELRSEISYAECSAHRRRQPTTDSHYARMYRACRKCPQNGGKS